MFKPNDFDLMKEYCNRQETRCEAVRLGDEVQSARRGINLPTLRPVTIFSLLLIVTAFIMLVAFFALNTMPIAA